MKKLLALIALVGLVAFNADARRRCYDNKCEDRCEVRCKEACPPCNPEPACEMIDEGTSVVCPEQPVCKRTFCVQPKKVCRKRTVVECNWVCPKDCAIFDNENSAAQHTQKFMSGDGSY